VVAGVIAEGPIFELPVSVLYHFDLNLPGKKVEQDFRSHFRAREEQHTPVLFDGTIPDRILHAVADAGRCHRLRTDLGVGGSREEKRSGNSDGPYHFSSPKQTKLHKGV
jgi:hypothetical protein